jgi:hypothetical protein
MNKAKPLLMTERDGMRPRIVRARRRRVSDIARADVRQAPGTSLLMNACPATLPVTSR